MIYGIRTTYQHRYLVLTFSECATPSIDNMPASTTPAPSTQHQSVSHAPIALSAVVPQSMKDWYNWSWVKVCLRIGGPKTAQRIQDSMLTIGLTAAIFLTFQVCPIVNYALRVGLRCFGILSLSIRVH